MINNKRILLINRLVRILTITAISQVGPDDVLLWEAEDPQTAASHASVCNDSRVCHQICAFIELHSASKESKNVTSVSSNRKPPVQSSVTDA